MQLGSTNSKDTTTLLGLTRQWANTLSNLNAFSDAQITAALNQEQRKLQTFILSQVMYEWRDAGTVLNGTGNGSISLVSGQNNYNFPDDLVTLDRVEINYEGNTNGYVEVTPYKLEALDSAVSNISNNNAFKGSYQKPIYYVRGGVIYIDPVPTMSVTGGLKVFCTTKVTDLTGSTDEPIFVEAYQEILCLGAAFKYLATKGKGSLAGVVKSEMNELKNSMIQLYSSRDQDTKVGLRPKTQIYI